MLNQVLYSIKLNEYLLTLANCVTCLGIEIDETLSWNSHLLTYHIEALAEKVSRTNRILSTFRYRISV